MTRLSGKTLVQRAHSTTHALRSDFNKEDFDGLVASKGYDVIHEKAYLCPCKSKESTHRDTCRNCGGKGWLFCNPTETRMIITGIALDNKLKEGALRDWGMLDMGAVKITANNIDKLSYMDRITILDATAEHNQIVYPKLSDDESELFAYTKYDIISIDFIGAFNGEIRKITQLAEPTDYTFRDNVLLFDIQYNTTVPPCVTIRYVHRPSFHIIDILRESMTSPSNDGTVKQILPTHAIGKRAHLISDTENFDGDRLLDNSWKPSCEIETLSVFQRQIRFTDIQVLYNLLTASQKVELSLLLADDDTILGVNGGVLQINP